MAILWCGGEEIDFPNGVAIGVTSSTSYYRAGYARCALSSSGGAVFTSNPFSTTALPPVWLSAQCYFNNGNSPSTCVGLTDITGQGILVRRRTSGEAELVKKEGSTITVLAAEATPYIFAVIGIRKVDLYISNYGTGAVVQVYVNATQTPVLSYTGDITIAGVPLLSCVSSGGNAAAYFDTSEFIVADQDTRLMSVVTLAPTATGDLNEWNGTYTNIDEAVLSDADTIYTDQVDKTFECNLSGLPVGNFVVKGVKVAARAVDGVGGLALQGGIKTNGTVNLGTPVTLGSTWKTIEQLYAPNNPVTNQPFTTAEIEALQLALKTVAAG